VLTDAFPAWFAAVVAVIGFALGGYVLAQLR
jgi:hypothetical protein